MSSGMDTHPLVLVSAFLDGELSADETALVEAHLAGCPSCRALFEDYRVIAASTASLTTPPVPEDLRTRISRRLGAATGGAGRQAWFRPRSYRVALGAAAGVVLVLGLWILRQEGSPGRSTLPAVAQPTPGSSRPADAARETGDLSVAEIRRNELREPESRLGAQTHREGSAQQEGRPSTPAVSDRPEPVAPEVKEEVLQEKAPAVAGKDALRRPAPEAFAGEAAAEAGGGPAPAARNQGPPPAFSRPDATAAAPPASARAAPRREGTHGRILLFEFPDHAITLCEDGTLTLSSGQYACTVRPGQPAAAREVARLFRLASRQGPEATGSGSATGPEEAPVSSGITLQDERGSVLRATGWGMAGGIDRAAAVEMDTRLHALLRDRYIGLLESRCGAVPETVHAR